MAQAVTPRPSGVGPTTPALASAFSMPVISPVTERPPYRYRDCKAVNILFTTDAAVLEGLLPPPLTPDLDQPSVLYIGHYVLADYDLPYNEAGLLVPARLDGRPVGAFAVVLYLDRANPIVGGREVYGWPKKDADQILVDEQEGRMLGEVTRYGHRIIRVTLAIQQTVDPIPERPEDSDLLPEGHPVRPGGRPTRRAQAQLHGDRPGRDQGAAGGGGDPRVRQLPL